MNNKVVIVTGGANGIGKDLIDRLLYDGAYVATIDLVEIQRTHDRLFTMKGDLTDKVDLDRFVFAIKERFETVELIINNAMLTKEGILSNCSFEDFQKVLTIGVTVPYYLTMQLLPIFSEWASIVNMSSTRANQSQPNTESYSSAKGGVLSLTHALSVSLAGKARVNAISPGWIHTGDEERLHKLDHEQHSVKRVGTTDDIIELIYFLSSKKASFITGENFVIDGGMSKQMIYHNDNNWSLKEK